MGLNELDRVFLVERRAVGGDAGVNPVLVAERHQVDEARLDERLAAAEADRKRADKVLDAQQGRLPLFNRHLIAILRQPPVFAVAALHVAALVHDAVERHGLGVSHVRNECTALRRSGCRYA